MPVMPVLLLLHLAAAAVLLVLFTAVACRPHPARRPRWAAAVLAVGQVGVLGYLWSLDWRFAADLVLVALPPLVVAVALVPPVGDPAPWRRRAAVVAALVHAHLVVRPPAPPPAPDLAVTAAVLAVAVGLCWLSRRHAVPAGRWPRTVIVVVLVVGLAGAGTAMWAASRLPATASMTDHGVLDYGGGETGGGETGGGHTGGHHGHGVDIATLTGPRDQTPDRRRTLTARTTTVTLASGERVDAWTFDGALPGPELRVRQGELVEVTLVNQDVPAGVTIHWHGLDVPNAEDGVAGLTQNAVAPGERHVYRFVAEQTGTFWYHSHQQSDEQVRRGLFGTLVVEPRTPPARTDLVVLAHAWNTDTGQRTAVSVAGEPPSTRTANRRVPAGTLVRLRLVNADNEPRSYTVAGAPFRVVAIDGTALSGPPEITGRELFVAGGGRYDVELTMPAGTVQLAITQDENTDDGPSLVLSPDGRGEATEVTPGPVLDPTDYGTPAATPFDADSAFDRVFTLLLGESIGFYNGRFGRWATINGAVYPNTPVLAVREGDLVRVTFLNRGFEDHPMHLHGHHMLVLRRDGRPVVGSPWWTDTLNVAPGERFEVAFRADNPGLWMDHCHNLTHAADGMTTHLRYLGYRTRYRVGSATGNQPE